VDGNSSQGTAPAMDGTVQEHIELNPKSNGTGIGLCNYGQTDATCGLILDGYSVVHVTSGGLDHTAATYATAPSHMNAGGEFFCTDCYSSSNSAKTPGIPVYWNGSAFVDALGQTAQHP